MSMKAMTAAELAEIVINQKDLFILDVRNEDAFKDWQIEGKNVEILNIPYFDLLEGVESVLPRIPADKPVIVVCAKEGSSKFVAEQLVEAANRDVYYLEGGMKTWSEHVEPVKIGDLYDGGELYQFVRIGKGCLSYMVVSGGEAIVIDPMRLTNVYTDFLKQKNAVLKYAVDTHLHADHISGGRILAEKTGAAYYIPEDDAAEVTFSYKPLNNNDVLQAGKTEVAVQALYSPGHTIGSTSLIVDNRYLLTGDILFIDSIGRPDLAGKAEDWVGDLRESLYVTYQALNDDLLVLPAHFSKKEEMDDRGRVMEKLRVLYKENAGLQVEDEEIFRKMVTENLPLQPNAYEEIRQTNMGRVQPEPEEQTEMEIGPNRCAVS
ncbi:glyoxylase-like metal-dependent hydrolase (beta-lactamase superfamily II) [Sinobaca qinghaiensis]|uniref:Glyoxylase-like metal-dependent hydrolase (Beta-lactamase superfamily II) n=1 Tax=Sinobaca qinghaiensis TaxID=342944 RepID=A0A419V627_9BACL|nr:MBL fold metallo-hydrolase [Sinobaca qinghaiensis]RKD75291.1 glyoxylase-like metal-dependent hydrolase (beta-lactamase superfamily II) [Sinobaca qinghaiensis]